MKYLLIAIVVLLIVKDAYFTIREVLGIKNIPTSAKTFAVISVVLIALLILNGVLSFIH